MFPFFVVLITFSIITFMASEKSFQYKFHPFMLDHPRLTKRTFA